MVIQGDGGFLVGVETERISISNLNVSFERWDGKVNNYQTAIELRGCRDVDIRNCSFNGIGGMGIKLCARSGRRADGSRFDELGDGRWRTTHVTIADCQFNGISGAAIGCKPGGASYVDILRCRIERFGSYGLCLEGDAGNGPLGMCSHVAVTGCEIKNGSPALFFGDGNDSAYGIYIGEDAHKIEVNHCTIDDINAKNRAIGICVATSKSQGDRPVSNVSVRSSTVRAPIAVLQWMGAMGDRGMIGVDIDQTSNLLTSTSAGRKPIEVWR